MKKFIRWFLGVLLAVFVITACLIGPIDDTPLSEQPFFQTTMEELEKIQPIHHPGKLPLQASWAAINITPHSPMPMAGYTPRDHFDKVHDSIYVRMLAFDNGSVRCFIVSADLLLFPPALKSKIEAKVLNKNRFLYFTATHVHSSLGGWDDSVIGNLILGKYDEQWIDSLADTIVSSMEKISNNLKPCSVSYFEADAEEYVENRIDSEKGEVDGYVRGFKIRREDGTKALFATYSAHPTNISHLSLELSGDYPNALVKKAEDSGYDFAMFGAGMVGSHRSKWMEEREFVMCDTLAARLFRKIQASESEITVDAPEISTSVFPIHYGPSQLHVLEKFKVRDWAFRGLFSPLKGEINYLKIGNVVMLGMPCDFSGEIFNRERLGKAAEIKKEKLFITSFNGEYVGYITHDSHYGRSEQEEVMAMNWVGPFYGEYYSRVIKKILEKD